MVDFFRVTVRSKKKDLKEIYPQFIIRNPSDDLMIRGGDFYAVWIEERGLWSTSEQDLIDLVDRELDRYYEAHKAVFDGEPVHILYMKYAETGTILTIGIYATKRNQFRSKRNYRIYL